MTTARGRRIRPVRAAPAGQAGADPRALGRAGRSGPATRTSCRPTWRGRREDRAAARGEPSTRLVIGGGVAGSCLAYWLAREGIETLVVERDDVNLQASGANAGSLHVQLLSFDFGQNAPAGGNRAADTLPLGPASVALWQEIQRDTGERSRDEGRRRPDAGRDRARRRLPQGQDRAREESRHRGRADRRQRAAPARARQSATPPSPPNGARARARSIRCAPPMP